MHAISMTTKTEFASKYLQQLCKHFAHKVTVSYDEKQAEVAFPFGQCRMDAQSDELTIHFQTDNETTLQQAREVIDVHLLRFAFKEQLQLDWQSADPIEINLQQAG